MCDLTISEIDKLWPLACIFERTAEQDLYIFKGKRRRPRRRGKKGGDEGTEGGEREGGKGKQWEQNNMQKTI